jgi:hypothetical protein
MPTSSRCIECGEKVEIRHCRGRLIPFGCKCHQRQRTPRSFRTTCPICGCNSIYLIRHNGGTVWLDELAPPWPIHGCFNDHKSMELLIPGASFSCLGTVGQNIHEDWLGRSVLFISGTRFVGHIVFLSAISEMPVPGDLVALSGSSTISDPSWSPSGQGELLTPSYSNLHLVGCASYEIASDARICSECHLLTRAVELTAHIRTHPKK